MSVATTLNGKPITQLRGLPWLLLSDTGRVVSLATSDDGGGGATEAWTAGADIPCRIDPVAGGEGLVGERLSDRTTHVITVVASTAITAKDRFEVDGHGTYAITAVRDQTRTDLLQLEAVSTT